MNTYKTRKQQMQALTSQFLVDAELTLTRKQRRLLNQLVRDACMCGAAEITYCVATGKDMTAKSVLQAIGYDE